MKHEELCVVLREMGMPQHLIVLMHNLCCGQAATLGKVSDKSALYLRLFNRYEEHIMEKTGLDSEEQGVKIGRKNVDS